MHFSICLKPVFLSLILKLLKTSVMFHRCLCSHWVRFNLCICLGNHCHLKQERWEIQNVMVIIGAGIGEKYFSHLIW